jgi:hypothetical protein
MQTPDASSTGFAPPQRGGAERLQGKDNPHQGKKK